MELKKTNNSAAIRKAAVPKWKPTVALAVTILLWASAFAGISDSLKTFGPFEMAALRFLVASAFFLVLRLFGLVQLLKRKDIPGLFLIGLIGIAGYNLALNYGQLFVNAGSASFIISSVPIMSAIIAHLFLSERLNLYGYMGLTVSFVGISLIALQGEGSFTFNRFILLIVLAAVFMSVSFVLQKKYLKNYDAITVTAHMTWYGTLVMLFFIPGLISQMQTVPISAIAIVTYLGIFPAALGYLCWNYALKHLNVARAAGTLNLTPIAAVIIAWIWLGETISGIGMIGGALTLIGVTVVRSGHIKRPITSQILPKTNCDNSLEPTWGVQQITDLRYR